MYLYYNLYYVFILLWIYKNSIATEKLVVSVLINVIAVCMILNSLKLFEVGEEYSSLLVISSICGFPFIGFFMRKIVFNSNLKNKIIFGIANVFVLIFCVYKLQFFKQYYIKLVMIVFISALSWFYNYIVSKHGEKKNVSI